jgi:predicted metal-dependent phosphoesterase TrpH
LPDAQRAGAAFGIHVITGVELSADEGGREIHLLGLHLRRPDAIEGTMATLRAARIDRARRMVDRLNALGIPVTFEAVEAQAGTGAIGRPHVARAIVAGGWAADPREVFDRWLGHGRPANVPKARLTVAEAIRLVHDAGGLAIVAHPGVDTTRARLERYAADGLDGVEVWHPSHSADEVRRLRALADHLRLVASGGSDWHGAVEGPRTIGVMRVPYEVLAAQEVVLAARVARGDGRASAAVRSA